MSDIRGIHYEISKPVRNPSDGYYYQRIRQVDDQGKLVGIGEYVQRSSAPNSRDALVGPGLDLTRVGKTLGDAGQAALGLLGRNFQMAGAGATRFANDLASGVSNDYQSWPGTDAPWHDYPNSKAGSPQGSILIRKDWVDDPSRQMILNSMRDAGIASRGTVFENNYPDAEAGSPTVRQGWNADPARAAILDSARAAGMASPGTVFEHGFPEVNPAQSSLAPAPLPRAGVFAAGAAAIPFSPAASQNAPRGLPALLAEVGAVDPSNPAAPPAGGLAGLIQDYMRTHHGN